MDLGSGQLMVAAWFINARREAYFMPHAAHRWHTTGLGKIEAFAVHLIFYCQDGT
jgi:hypothetical protein